MPLYTQQQPSKSLADRLFTAEFDDSIIEQQFWKNPRYDGCKVISKEINKYTPLQTESSAITGVNFASISIHGPTIGSMILGGVGLNRFTVGGIYSHPNFQGLKTNNLNLPGVFKVENFIPHTTWPGDSINPSGLNANLKRETTALYISNTVIGGTEDPQFATIQNHSYININQILLIDPLTDETQLIDKQAEDFIPFHSFITNDLPTKESFSIKLIDESVSNNLKGPNQYKVKMNKGFLLKTFDFQIDSTPNQLTENNSMYLYKGGTKELQLIEGVDTNNTGIENNNRTRFKYGTIELIPGSNIRTPSSDGDGHILERKRIGPSFASSSIINNKFTQQYYSGSFGLINEPTQPQGSINADILKTSGLGSASRFIGLNTLSFLVDNNQDANLSIQEKTELHITFFEGTKDFTKGVNESISANDERSIGTFEVDTNQSSLTVGSICQSYLPTDHELFFKGLNDDRFNIKTTTFGDDFYNGYMTSSFNGTCVPIGTYDPATSNNILMQRGINVDFTNNALVYIQGGFLGQDGYQGAVSGNAGPFTYGRSNSGSMTTDNQYSGSFSYELSFLDKDHTIITNLDKTAELFDGIGTKGIIIIPENTHPKIKNNIQYYLQQAGIIDSSPNTQLQISNDTN